MIRDRLIFVSIAAGGVTNILLWIILLSKFGLSPEPVPLHFNIVYGIDLVGSARQIYQIPAAGLAIILINFFLGKLLYDKDRLASYFLVYAASFIQMILLIAGISLVVLGN